MIAIRKRVFIKKITVLDNNHTWVTLQGGIQTQNEAGTGHV